MAHITDDTIIITNPKVISYFKSHTSISVEYVLLLMIDLMDKTTQDSIGTNLASQMLEQLKVMNTNINQVSSNIHAYNADMISRIQCIMIDVKDKYIQDVKDIVTTNTLERIPYLLKEQETHINTNMNLLLNDITTKSNDTISSKMSDIIKDLQSNIHENTSRLSTNPEILKDFIMSIDNKFTMSLMNTQQILNSSTQQISYNIQEIRSNQEKTTSVVNDIVKSNIIDLKHYNDQQFLSLQNISSTNQVTVNELLKKMDNSAYKGKLAENILFNILQSLYPMGYIHFNAGSLKESGDFIVEREDKPKILFENKKWDRPIIKTEVQKFIRDTEINKCCGVLLSQDTAIANKYNYEIDVYDGNVLVYVHFANNDPDKIKIAVDIIDHLKPMLDDTSNSSHHDTIHKDVLYNINKEYSNFVQQKLTLTRMIRDFQQSVYKQIDQINLPILSNYLSSRYGEAMISDICKYCNKSCKNIAALKQHLRHCPKKIENSSEATEDNNIDDLDNESFGQLEQYNSEASTEINEPNTHTDIVVEQNETSIVYSIDPKKKKTSYKKKSKDTKE
jgi:hypothetical protein